MKIKASALSECNQFIYLDIFPVEPLYSYIGYVLCLLKFTAISRIWTCITEHRPSPSLNAVSRNVSKRETTFVDPLHDLDMLEDVLGSFLAHTAPCHQT